VWDVDIKNLKVIGKTVHIGCIGIHYKNKTELEKLPYFCPKHILKTKKIGKKN
jgi:hypothetical protein